MSKSSLRPRLMAALENGLHLYAITNQTSPSKPLAHFSSSANSHNKPLWLGTPYRNWFEVMPTLIALPVDDPFVDWVEQVQPEDWGMFVLSPYDFDTVYDHFQSLTQVWISSSQYGFFRFFDPRYGIRVAELCDPAEQTKLMGPTSAWLCHQRQIIRDSASEPAPAKPFPWWDVPQSVTKQLAAESQDTLITNLITDLHSSRPDLANVFAPLQLVHKTTHFIRHYRGASEETRTHFIQWIEKESRQLL